MCGLTGILCLESTSDINREVAKMTSKLIHRGPDGEGFWSDNRIGLGHRRLSIIDLSAAGNQPMISNCERLVIAYNGEIYNHLELRDSLNKEGAAPKWRGHSDTETLLAAISHWGIDEALTRSFGMFAFALWNRENKTLSLARDRMGEKPLYWGWAGKNLIFGSELKALRAHPQCPTEVCSEALSLYLRFMYVPSPRSIYPNIYKLEPGTILTVNEVFPVSPPKKPLRPGQQYGSLSIHRYWDLNSQIEACSEDAFNDDKEAVSLLGKTLTQTVKRQMISDVPLGVFLSGGVDSSTITALMQKQITKPIKTFTIGFDESAYDESSNAAEVAQYLGTDHTKLQVTDEDARHLVPDLPKIYDEPFADSSQIPTHLVCRAARQNVTVALSGDGGDELFGGYNRYIYGPSLWKRMSYLPFYIRRFIGFSAQQIPEQFWNWIEVSYNQVRSGSSRISNLGNKANRLGERMRLIKSFDEFYLNMASNWIEPEKLLLSKVIEPNSQLNDPLPKYGVEDPAAWMMMQDMRSYLPDDILCKVDRAAMGISLETRAPFLDPDVIALSARLPTNMKIRNGQSKWALRQVLYKYVPPRIIDRPKVGFAVPIGSWLREPLREWAADLLSTERLNEDRIFNPEIIHKTLSEHLTGRRDWTNLLWSILMFQAWSLEQKKT